MTWQTLTISPCSTHHVRLGLAAYPERFDQVLKFHSPGLAPVRREAAAWHIHPNGQPAYPQRFRRTFGFYEGLAAVIGSEGWFHITPSGDTVYPLRHAWCGNFQEGRCTVRQLDGFYLHITPAGEPAYGERWHYAGDFRDGVGVVQAENGHSTHIDPDGRMLHNQWFLDLDVFHKGFARARDAAGWMHVDRHGDPRYKRRFAAVEPFYNGQARVERFDGGLEVIDEAGDVVVELRPVVRSEFAALSSDMVGFWRTQTIAAAVELGVVEGLPGKEEEVARRCRLCPDRTRRLLRALGELSLVVQDGREWQCTPRGAYLRRAHPLTLADAAREYARYFSKMWDALPEALRDRGGWQAPDIFGDVARDESRQGSHHRMLLSYARHDYPGVPTLLDLRGDERLVDAGGGLGFLAKALSESYPKLRVVLFDRPEVIEQAQQLQSAVTRIEWRAGDIFQPWQVAADAVVLARVLHDWDDAAAAQILQRAREALFPGGRVFLIEMIVAEEGTAGSLCDLHLLMTNGGRERTKSEYAHLLAHAGFELTEVRRLAALPSILVGVAR